MFQEKNDPTGYFVLDCHILSANNTGVKRIADYPDLLTLGETAFILRMSTRNIRRIVSEGAIPAIRVYKSIRIRKQVLIDFINDQTGAK
jgi:hypothetical protein